ncbi:MAG TPA: protein translocase subunit SecF [Myxococcota bacterium]|nr:protein translocase subunit SecF [Myxococcota bacterium]
MPIEIIPPGTNFDFIGKWKWCVAASLAVLLAGALAIPVRGLRWGIDFAGGIELQVHFGEGVAVDEGKIRGAVADLGLGETSVVRFGEAGHETYEIRFAGAQTESDESRQGQLVDRIQAALAEKIGKVEVDRVDFVGPKVGADLRRDGIKAFTIAFALILVYIAFRFTFQFAPGAVVALVHDVFVACAVWILLGQEFDLQVLAALLGIAGYSLNDTIIVYDRIREMMGVHTSQDLPDVINRSVNQTLSRTILTSGITMLAVLALLLVGGPVIRPFAAVMAIGILVGTYSSIYIAAPIMLLLERRFGAAKTSSTPSRPGAAGKGSGKSGKRDAKGARAARA